MYVYEHILIVFSYYHISLILSIYIMTYCIYIIIILKFFMNISKIKSDSFLLRYIRNNYL